MIHFRCIRCQHIIDASEESTGAKMYCPVCYFEITVPRESTIKEVDESQLYAADSEPVDVREMINRQKTVSLRCPICNTNIAVTKEQVGQILVCPECETKVRVPKSITAKLKHTEEKWTKINQSQNNKPSNDIYAISGKNSTISQNKTIRVYCKLCGTLMYALETQIGTELTCPDCETKTVVAAPSKSVSTPPQLVLPPLPSLFEGGKTFGLADNNSPPNSNVLLVPVVCALCGTRMYAEENEIGGFKTCPDCGRQNEIKNVPKKERIQPDIIQGGSYNVGQSNESEKRPVIRTLTDYRYVDGSLDKEFYTQKHKTNPATNTDNIDTDITDIDIDADADYPVDNNYSLSVNQVPQLPKYPFITRIFLPFNCAMLWGRVLVSFWFMLLGIIFAVFFLPAMLVMIGCVLGSILVIHGFLFLADTFYTLFQSTMVGNDSLEREDWNEFRLFEFGTVFVWLLFLCTVSSLPGYLLFSYSSVFQEIRQDALNAILFPVLLSCISSLIFFPIFFLSSVESNSGFMILAKGTCWSLISCFGVWFRFYFISFLLLAFFCAIVILLASTINYIFLPPILILITPIWSIFTIFYARILGRLSWTIEESIQQKKKKNKRT
ncbi:MAG: hypothetical protein LBT09_09315 [Planctomycetaceae bacterium]|jgi:DNA-directed RNA polymerase subunit M/transcription elongation factor TFIIS|nr:hypothetical protein [Planctomycetaceae bacterium]